jgi:hypothetical protein
LKKDNPLRYLYWPFLTIRAKSISDMLCPFIDLHSKVLDVGTGNMLVSKYLFESRKIEVQGIDVINMNLTNLPHKLFNGCAVPFTDKFFEISLLIGVLHHAENQEELLKDVMRVTSSKMIVFEDTYKTEAGKMWVMARDIIGNLPEELHMNFSLKFRTESEWNSLFEDLGLKIEFVKTYFNPIRLTHHTLYILRV